MSYQGTLQLPGGLSLRFATGADKVFLLNMFMAARPWLALSHGDEEYVRFLYEDQLRINGIGQETALPNHLDFVVERSGQAIGHLVTHLGREEWRIAQLELHPLVRGKGNGSDLLRGLQAGAERAGVALTASALTEMPRTLAFYRRLGFHIAGQRPPVTDLFWLPPALAAARKAAFQLNITLK